MNAYVFPYDIHILISYTPTKTSVRLVFLVTSLNSYIFQTTDLCRRGSRNVI